MSDIQTLSVYLLKSLPLKCWLPTEDDFEILAIWLLDYNIDSVESVAARTIISNLNWDIDKDDRLFISHECHVRMACLILQALTKHSSASIFYKQETLIRYTNWSWDIVVKLRLHLMDRGKTVVEKTIVNPFEMLVFIPELDRIDIINTGKHYSYN